MKYRKRPVEVSAKQWFVHGDHHAVIKLPEMDTGALPLPAHEYGWIATLEGGHIVTPGDWIITGVRGEHYPCKPEIFDETYELVRCPP